MKKEGTTGNQIIEGAIWKQLLIFFFPIMLGTFFQQFYNTIDMLIVGRFVGKEALASVGGSAAQIVNLIVGFFTGLAGGAGVIISQYYGAGNGSRVNDGIHTAYAFSFIGGIFFTIVGILCSPKILRMMNTPEELMSDSIRYLALYFGGILFVFIFNIGSGILRALGDSRRPLYYLIICSLINIVLDLITVTVLKMGVPGVALATVLAQAVSALLVTRALMRPGDIYQLQPKSIRIHPSLLKSQLYIGLPGGIQSVMYALSNIVIQAAINVYGTDAAAAMATTGKIDAVFWMVNGAFGVSIVTFVGQNYGAGRMDRVYRGTGICLAMYQVAALILSTGLVVFRHPLMSIFTTDANVIRLGGDIMYWLVPYYVIFSFVEILSGCLRGLSDVLIPMFITIFGICVMRLVWIFLVVPMKPSFYMIMLNYPVTWVLTAVLFIIYFLYRKQKRAKATLH